MRFFQTQSKKAQHRSSGGYSLVETVVYVGLFITLSTVLVGSLLGMFRAYTALRVNDDLLDSAHVSIERMSREIRNAVSIDTGGSTLGTTGGVLKLNTLDSLGAPKTVEFSAASSALQMLDSTDGTPRTLTGSKVTISSLVFRNVTTSIGSAVRLEVTFRSERTPAHRTVSMTDTIVLRGSY
jgi:type II secretory pathway pseudopilin PulG